MSTQPRLLDEPPAESITMLNYGVSGVGKTWFAGTAGDRTLYVDTGAGIETLRSVEFQRKVGANPIVKSIFEIIGRGKSLEPTVFDTVCDVLDEAFSTYLDRFDTVVLDDLSSFAKNAQYKGMELSIKSHTLDIAKAAKSIPLAVVDDIGTEMDMLSWFFDTYTKKCKELKKHFIVLAHERVIFKRSNKIGEEPTVFRRLPLAAGKDGFAPNVLPGFFDLVWRSYALGADNQRRYMFQTQPTEITIGKSRHAGVFKSEEVNLTFPDIVRRIKEAHSKLLGERANASLHT